jgi:1-acyl-sn-glycerol-3-phosphate acyltransferase
MIRFYFVIIASIGAIIYYVPKMAYYAKHTEKYSEKDCYALAQIILRKVQKTARVTTEFYGVENLPKTDRGYIMFANHQGKYDGLAVMLGHERPCAVLMDKSRSYMPIAKQFIDLIKGQRLDRKSPRQQIAVLSDMAKEVDRGRAYLVFPEGGYRKRQDNTMNEFKYGCFLCATKAKCPIVPVALIDCYKPFGRNSLKPVTTKTVYLKPIEYEEYCDLKAPELADLVKSRIQEEIDKWTKA